MSSKVNAADNSFDLADLMSGPLVSTVEADTLATRKFMAFLNEFGFDRSGANPHTDLGKLRMLSFEYPQAQQDGGTAPMRLQVPALTMVPLPLLQVMEAEFDFAVRIIGATKPQAPTRGPNELLAPGAGPSTPPPPAPERYRFKALLARGGNRGPQDKKSPGPSLEMNLKVHVKMRHADMPAGMGSVLQLLSERVHVQRLERPPEPPPSPPEKPLPPEPPPRPRPRRRRPRKSQRG